MMDYLRERKDTRERESVSKEVLCCNTLQHTATHCNTLQERERQQRGALLQHTATHCNTLQYTATHYNTLHERERQQRGALSIYKYDYVFCACVSECEGMCVLFMWALCESVYWGV